MPNNSKKIHVIGIDTSSVESFFEAKKKPILESERITGPQRILDSFKNWLTDKNIKNHKFEFISTDKLTIEVLVDFHQKNSKAIKKKFFYVNLFKPCLMSQSRYT